MTNEMVFSAPVLPINSRSWRHFCVSLWYFWYRLSTYFVKFIPVYNIFLSFWMMLFSLAFSMSIWYIETYSLFYVDFMPTTNFFNIPVEFSMYKFIHCLWMMVGFFCLFVCFFLISISLTRGYNSLLKTKSDIRNPLLTA